MGTDETQTLALLGVGDLGRALLSYRGFEERRFHIAASFDVDPEKIGRVFAGRRCYAPAELERVIDEHAIRLAVLASRPEGLQAMADRLAAAGVRGILNFVLRRLVAPDGCFVEHIDISARLEKLSFLSHARVQA